MNRSDQWACGYYRAVLPFRHCQPVLAHEGISLEMPEAVSPSDPFDVMIFHRILAPNFWPWLYRFAERGTKIVWESDDNLEQIPPWSPARRIFRPEHLEGFRICCERSHELLVSTNELKNQMGFPDKTTALPNLVDLNDWPRTQFAEQDDWFRVLWAGSDTHERDLDLVVPALKRFKDAHDNVQLIFFGMVPNALVNEATFIPLNPLEVYPDLMQLIRPHVGIAPLEDIPFNKAKSNIKYLELTLAGCPVIASDITPYSETIDDNEDGLLAKPDAWFDKLESLYQSNLKRKSLWERAMVKVKDEFSWQGQKKELWLDWFRKVAR